MKNWFRLFLCFCLLIPVVPVDLSAAPKQVQKKSKKKQTPAQRKREAERKKQIAERAAAVRKKKAEEEAREEKEKKDAENERIHLQVAEIKKDIKFASFRLDDVELELKKLSSGRNVITQSIVRALSKPEKPTFGLEKPTFGLERTTSRPEKPTFGLQRTTSRLEKPTFEL